MLPASFPLPSRDEGKRPSRHVGGKMFPLKRCPSSGGRMCSSEPALGTHLKCSQRTLSCSLQEAPLNRQFRELSCYAEE